MGGSEGSMMHRKLIDEMHHSGGVVETARYQGQTEQLEKPSSSRPRNRRKQERWYNRQSTGKSTEGETVAARLVVAMKRSNVRRAKGPCCTSCRSSTGGRGELINAPINLQDRKHRLCVPRKAPLWGHINRDVKIAGARSAGNPPAACDAAGVGDGITELPKRARRWKRRIQPRNFLRIYAPALDPTTY